MLSEAAKNTLDQAIGMADKEGYTVWGYILTPDGGEIQTFTNSDPSVAAFIHNTTEANKALAEIYEKDTN